MHHRPHHPTDRELLLALDHELPNRQQVDVDAHVALCDTCRVRRAALEDAASATAAIYRAEMTSTAGVEATSRARLQSTLDTLETGRPWNAGFGVVVPSRRAVVAAAALTAVALLAWLPLPTGPVNASVETRLAGRGPLPVASVTPGATWDVSTDDLCAGTRHTRPISAVMRVQILRAYGMEDVPSDEYELDYLITPELGGATDTRNLWPQPYGSGMWNARVKDELEQLLPQLVCSRRIGLMTAQREMAVDWVAAYKKYFNTDQPLRAHRGPGTDDDEVETFGEFVMADARPAPAIRLISMTVVR